MRRSILALMVVTSACGSVHGMRVQSPITTAPPTTAPVEPPPTFVATTSDARMTRVIDVREGLTKAQAFKSASDYLAEKFSIDVSDARAGFLMTTWQNTFMRANGAPDLHYRTRLIVRVGDDGRQASIRSEANWQRGDGWDTGYDSQMLEDAVVEVRTRIGTQRKSAAAPTADTRRAGRVSAYRP